MEESAVRPRWALRPAIRRTIYALIILESIFWANYSYRHVPILGLCCYTLGPGGRSHHPAIPRALVIEENSGLRVTYGYSDDAARVQSSPRPGEVIRAQLVCFPQPDSWGLLAPVCIKWDHSMHIMALTTPLSATELQQVRSLYTAFLKDQWDWRQSVPPEYLRLLAAGNGTTTQVRWGWLAHDIIAGSLLIWAIASTFSSFGPERARLRQQRNADLLAAAQCPACRYNLTGLTQGPDKSCPECGRPLTP